MNHLYFSNEYEKDKHVSVYVKEKSKFYVEVPIIGCMLRVSTGADTKRDFYFLSTTDEFKEAINKIEADITEYFRTVPWSKFYLAPDESFEVEVKLDSKCTRRNLAISEKCKEYCVPKNISKCIMKIINCEFFNDDDPKKPKCDFLKVSKHSWLTMAAFEIVEPKRAPAMFVALIRDTTAPVIVDENGQKKIPIRIRLDVGQCIVETKENSEMKQENDIFGDMEDVSNKKRERQETRAKKREGEGDVGEEKRFKVDREEEAKVEERKDLASSEKLDDVLASL